MAESPCAAAVREVLEETGLTSSRCRTLHAFLTYDTRTPYVHIPVIMDDCFGEPSDQLGEKLTQLGFFDLNTLPHPLFTPSAEAITQLLRSQCSSFSVRGS